MRNFDILLDSYHPIDKLTKPPLFCEYIDTDGLSEAGADADMTSLNRLYTRFRPHFDEGSRPARDEVPSHEVHLESEELFWQLCTTVELVQNGPRRGLFSSSAPVCDHVVRITRTYLCTEATASAEREKREEICGANASSILWTNASENVGLKFRVIEDRSASGPTFIHTNENPPVSYRLEYQGTFTECFEYFWQNAVY